MTPEPGGETALADAPRFITPAMRPARLDRIDPNSAGKVFFKGKLVDIAVAPDPRCDLNKGNHSVRGASQGQNLVAYRDMADADVGSAFVPVGDSTKSRLTSPWVRLDTGTWKEITWETLNKVMSALVVTATDMQKDGAAVTVNNPRGLGVKLYEYQYLENTYAATKLFYGAIGTPNLAYHDRPSASGSSPGLKDAGLRPHDFAYEDIQSADLIIMIGTNPYENQSVFFMQYCQGKEIVVIDPRLTATANYAVRTGGMHIQPNRLGADSRLIYAIARALIERWEDRHPGRLFPLHLEIGDPKDLFENAGDNSEKKRQASRARTFDEFKAFLGVGEPSQTTYMLDPSAEAAGLSDADQVKLQALLDKLIAFDHADDSSQPKVAILYEKGIIWGFNYHNTAALASLGVLLGAGSEPGRILGRVGGHQKGWAERVEPLAGFVYPQVEERHKSKRYPTHNATDRYTDRHLAELFDATDDAKYIKPKHNLDNHVFGPASVDIEAEPGAVDRPTPGGQTRRTARVRLKNGLETDADPDISLLWIIGGNYLGQTNDAAWKRQALHERMKSGRRVNPRRPKTTDPDDIIAALTQRMTDGGLVCVHQEIFPNPTTECCDIVIPAAGWGEETFCRYNAQRRLKLFERFQDMPLHKNEVRRPGIDPYAYIDAFAHSPKPDWMVLRDIATAIDARLDVGVFASNFSWRRSSEIADEMADASHRAPEHPDGLGLSALLEFVRSREPEIPEGERVHALLGSSAFDGNGNAEAGRLKQNTAVRESISAGEAGDLEHGPDLVSDVYTNGVASNGVFLPLNTRAADDGRTDLVGHLTVRRKGPFFFVAAGWEEIESAFVHINGIADDSEWREKGGVLVTNGRVNHLWNNMFHHLRNDYVNDRYPEDMPGTIVEVHPGWAAAQNPPISNGDIVRLARGPLSNEDPDPNDASAAGRNYRSAVYGVASLQNSVPNGMAFLMFSYPVTEGRHAFNFNFNGYVNNITDGHVDGINPIAALKYGHATLTKVPPERSGFPGGKFVSKARPGPLYEQRNNIGPAQPRRDRAEWELRELIVRKGLPRAHITRPFPWGPHKPHTVVPPGEAKTDFWRAARNLEEFRNMKVGGFTVKDSLPALLDGDASWEMPLKMLAPRDFDDPAPFFASRARVKAILRDGKEGDFAELKDLLDGLVRVPHNVVADLFLRPDDFVELMKVNEPVRNRFATSLGRDRRGMKWLVDGDDLQSKPIDDWREADLRIVESWIDGFPAGPDDDGPADGDHQQGDVPMTGFARVQEILDASVGGPDDPAGFFHGAFWRDVNRDAFVTLSFAALPIITLGDGAGSNLVKALKGEAPFGSDQGVPGATIRRMPAGMAPVPANEIAEIEAWIDAGAPAEDEAEAPAIDLREIRLLPALGLARFGSATEPMDNYEIVRDPAGGFSDLRPAETLHLDTATGAITAASTPAAVRFKDGAAGKVKPVAPFIELWARIGIATNLVPLTKDHLAALGLGTGDLAWTVRLGNLKAFRRTGDPGDRITSEDQITGHARQNLRARAPNFKADQTISLGAFQFVRPTEEFREIRARFTPPAGLVLGHTPDGNISPDRAVYDRSRGTWDDHQDQLSIPSPTPRARLSTSPGGIYAQDNNNQNLGYLDDSSDGVVSISFTVGDTTYSASSRISSGPPDYAPDSFPVRAFSDDLKQMIHGPQPEVVTIDETIEVVRKALETVRLMNTETMNRFIPFWEQTWSVRTDPDDRPFSPDEVDYPSAVQRHRGALIALDGLRAPPDSPERAAAVAMLRVIGGILREFTQASDYSPQRVKLMPGIMRGGDGNMLALCRRQRNIILRAAEQFAPDGQGDPSPIAAMVRLVDALAPTFAMLHSSVTLEDGRTLDELFGSSSELLTYLVIGKARGAVADRDGLLGDDLVIPGDPDGSAFFKMVNSATHPMNSSFAGYSDAVTGDDGIEVVRKWIAVLPDVPVG